MRRSKPYGTYSRRILEPTPYHMDVEEVQDSVAAGHRIRNKKQKRRLHNKRTRAIQIRERRKEIEEFFEIA